MKDTQQEVETLKKRVAEVTQLAMQISSEKSDLEDTLKAIATTDDEREKQATALAALARMEQAVRRRAAAQIDASKVAWDIRDINQRLDTLIQGRGDDISDREASAIIRDYDNLAQTVSVLESRVEINKL